MSSLTQEVQSGLGSLPNSEVAHAAASAPTSPKKWGIFSWWGLGPPGSKAGHNGLLPRQAAGCGRKRTERGTCTFPTCELSWGGKGLGSGSCSRMLRLEGTITEVQWCSAVLPKISRKHFTNRSQTGLYTNTSVCAWTCTQHRTGSLTHLCANTPMCDGPKEIMTRVCTPTHMLPHA